MQLLGCCILFYLYTSIDKMLEEKDVYRLLFFLMMNTFIITCQDIAVDSWAVDMLAPENSSYGSSSQSVGHKLGQLISTTVFIAFNSVEFCNKYVFSEHRTEPLLSIATFIWWWASGQAIITIYILLFVTEKEAENDEEEELEISITQAPAIFGDILKKP